MFTKRTQSITNRLIQRVQRHAGLTTLFGADQGAQPAMSGGNTQVVMRSWITPQTELDEEQPLVDWEATGDDWIADAESPATEDQPIRRSVLPITNQSNQLDALDPNSTLEESSLPINEPISHPSRRAEAVTAAQVGTIVDDSKRTPIQAQTVQRRAYSQTSSTTQPLSTIQPSSGSSQKRTGVPVAANLPNDAPVTANRSGATTALQRQPQNKAVARGMERPSPKEDEDPTWRRLQAIVRRHEEIEARKQASQSNENTPATGDATVPEGDAPSVSATTAVQRQADESRQVDSQATVVKGGLIVPVPLPPPNSNFASGIVQKVSVPPNAPSGTTDAIVHPKSEVGGIKNKAETQSEQHEQPLPQSSTSASFSDKGAVQRDVASLGNPVPLSASRLEQTRSNIHPSLATVGSHGTEMDEQSSRGELRPRDSGHTAVYGAEAVNSPPLIPEESSSPPLSLESVWPVQRMTEEGEGTRETRENPSEIQSPVQLEAGISLTATEGTAIRNRLGDVPTGQPTESVVDLVLPRRPRPVLRSSVATDAKTTVLDQSTPTGVESKTTVLQRSPEKVEIAPSSDVESQRTMPTGMVNTEIGPLPADLWTLIGEKAPQSNMYTVNESSSNVEPEISKQVNAPSDVGNPGRTIQRMTGESTSPIINETLTWETEKQPGESHEGTEADANLMARSLKSNVNKPIMMKTHPSEKKNLNLPQSWIMRQAELETGAEVPNSGISASQPASATPSASGDAVDIETLATQVYGRLKRKLALERERLR